MIHIFIADDYAVVRRGLHGLLKSEPSFFCVGEAVDGRGLLRAVVTVAPDILMLDLSMPYFPEPAEFVRQLKKQQPDVKVLVLTSYSNEELIYGVLQAGASGYVLKDEVEEVLIQALLRVAQGKSYYSQDVSEVMARHFVDQTPALSNKELTPRETEVLRLIGKGLNNTEITEELTITLSTVRSHISRINAKLGLGGLGSRAKTVQYAISHGYTDNE